MANDVSARIGLDGFASFRQASNLAIQQMKSLQQETKAMVSTLGAADKSEQGLTRQNEILGRSLQQAKERVSLYGNELEKQRNKLSSLASAVDAATREFGENSSEVNKAKSAYASQAIEVEKIQQRYTSAQGDVGRFTREIEENESSIRDIQRGFNDAGQEVDEYGNAVNRAGDKSEMGFGKMLKALGIFELAKAAMREVTAAIGDAVSRVDTLNAFPRVMTQMGFSAESAEKSIQRLSDGVQGLPTTLDSVVSSAQNIALMTGDLEGATETTLALNNAFLASGAGAQDAERGLDQYVKMLAKGKVEGDSWQTLQETMGYALREVAKEFGYTGDAAVNDLYAALQKGDVTFDQFNSKMVELSNATGGFAETAQTATGGIDTAMTNWRTAVVKGVADIIQEIDKGLEDFGGITGVINSLKDATKQVFSWVSQNIPNMIAFVKELYENIKPFAPLIAGVVVAMAGLSIIGDLSRSLILVKEGISSIGGALNLIMAHPIIAAVSLLVGALVYLWTTNEDFRNAVIGIWEGVKETVGGVVDALVGFFTETIPNAFRGVVDFFKNNWKNILLFIVNPFAGAFKFLYENVEGFRNFINNAWQSIVNFFTETIPAWIGSVIEWFNMLPQRIGEAIGFLLGSIVKFGQDAWTWVTTELPLIIEGIIEWFAALPGRVWEWLQNTIQRAIEFGIQLKDTVVTRVAETIEAVVGWFKQLPGRLKEWLTNTINNVVQWAKDLYNNAKQAATDFVTTVVDTIKSLPERMLNIGKDIVRGIWDGITGMFSWIKGKIGEFAGGIMNGFKNALGIHSPSTLARDILGKNFALGIGVGFVDNIKGVVDDMQSAFVGRVDTMGSVMKNYDDLPTSEAEFIPSNTYNSSLIPTIQITINAGGGDTTDWNSVTDTMIERISEGLEALTQQKLRAQGAY